MSLSSANTASEGATTSDAPVGPANDRALASSGEPDTYAGLVRSWTLVLITGFPHLIDPGVSLAGMPVILLSDLAAMRLEAISFFLALILLLAAAVRWLWNQLRSDLPRLPALSYRGSVALVVLSGLVFHLVLTMISGARELMTPGAWQKDDFVYRLSPVSDPLADRRAQLERLRTALMAYAYAHANSLPPHDFVAGIPAQTWSTPRPNSSRYVYIPGHSIGGAAALVAYEPEVRAGARLGLFTDGGIRNISEDVIALAIAPEEQ